MKSLKSYSGGVIPGLIPELEHRVRAAGEAGVPRRNILLDPGLGFAKDLRQKLELLRRLAEVTGGIGLSWVIGLVGRGLSARLPAWRLRRRGLR